MPKRLIAISFVLMLVLASCQLGATEAPTAVPSQDDPTPPPLVPTEEVQAQNATVEIVQGASDVIIASQILVGAGQTELIEGEEIELDSPDGGLIYALMPTGWTRSSVPTVFTKGTARLTIDISQTPYEELIGQIVSGLAPEVNVTGIINDNSVTVLTVAGASTIIMDLQVEGLVAIVSVASGENFLDLAREAYTVVSTLRYEP